MFVFALLISLVILPITSHAQLAQNSTSILFQNITTNSATLSFVIGNDEIGPMIQSHLPLTLKYRAVSPIEAVTSPNGSESSLPLVYTVNSPNPVTPITLSGLKTNQRYAIWIGQQAIRQCEINNVSCDSVYTRYTTTPVFFSTKLDPSTVPVITKDLSFQTKSKSVVLLKKYLSAHNFMTASTSKTFDIPTLVGVIKFQIANNLTTDGVIGSSSRNIINQWLLQVAQN